MTLRTTTLTAVAALAVALSGGAMAQDNGQDNGMSPIVPEASETTGQQDPAPASAPEAETEAPADAEAEAEPERGSVTTRKRGSSPIALRITRSVPSSDSSTTARHSNPA